MSEDKTHREEASQRIVSATIADIEASNASTNISPNEGVLAPAQSKKTGGQWLPGQSGNPGGRKSALRSSFGAIAAKVTPAQLAEMYWWGLEKAKEQGSPRIVLQYIEFYTHMTDGTPVQRSITASTRLESILAQVTDLSDEEFADVEQKLREG